ncbi:hypothetical protein THOE12_70153 [Vibrio rotiferianus]|nr:hypothetical protein THOE12_70153 [Vibrio rotiferianus]
MSVTEKKPFRKQANRFITNLSHTNVLGVLNRTYCPPSKGILPLYKLLKLCTIDLNYLLKNSKFK